MKNLTRELGVAMIIITHNLGVVARYADRVNVMYAGKIIEEGSAEDVYHRPAPSLHAGPAQLRAARGPAAQAPSSTRSRASRRT